MKILVVIPAYNEASNISNVVLELKEKYPQADYLIINDCSTDNTQEICKKNHFTYISLPTNLGIGGAVQTGYKYAADLEYDIVVQHDGDGQHDPGYLADAVSAVIKGDADMVIGSRFINNEGFQSSGLRRVGIKFISHVVKMCSGARVLDVTSGFRVVNKKYTKLFAQDYPQDYPEPEAIVMAKLNGATIKEVPVVMRERESGKSSINAVKSIYYMIKVTLALFIRRIFN